MYVINYRCICLAFLLLIYLLKINLLNIWLNTRFKKPQIFKTNAYKYYNFKITCALNMIFFTAKSTKLSSCVQITLFKTWKAVCVDKLKTLSQFYAMVWPNRLQKHKLLVNIHHSFYTPVLPLPHCFTLRHHTVFFFFFNICKARSIRRLFWDCADVKH